MGNTKKSTTGQFGGNLDAMLYGTKDGTANAVGDALGLGVSYGYTALAVAAGEEASRVPGPIGWVGNAVTLTIGVATSDSRCKVIGAVAGAGAGILGGAAALPGGPIAQYIAGTAASWATQKAVTALCETAEGYVNGVAPEKAAPAHAKTTNSTPLFAAGEPGQPSGFPHLLASGDASTMAAAIVKCRPSPDYSGSDGAYTVKQGQSLSVIAQGNDISLSLLAKTNPQIIDPSLVRVGQVIRLPPSAKDYVAGAGIPTGARSVPDDGAQTSALSDALRLSAGTTVSVITENSGRIAVLSPSSGNAVMIANDGSAVTQALSAYDQRVREIYNDAVTQDDVLRTPRTALDGHLADTIPVSSARTAALDFASIERNIYGMDEQGNIDPSLLTGDPQAVEAHAEQWLQEGGYQSNARLKLRSAQN